MELFSRLPENPLLSAEDVPFGASLVFNPAVIVRDNGYFMCFRADVGEFRPPEPMHSRLGVAVSCDGISWEVTPKPLELLPPAPEIRRLYDPRLVEIDGKTILCTAMDTYHGIQAALFSVRPERRTLAAPQLLHRTLPENRNVVLFPERIDGYYYRLDRPFPMYGRGGAERFDIWISRSPDLRHWGDHRLLWGVEQTPFADLKVGPAAPPILTKEGWLLLYHAVSSQPGKGKNGWEAKWEKRYDVGALLLSRRDPSRVIGAGPGPVMTASAPYERQRAFRKHAPFPTAAPTTGADRLRIYYGAADTSVCGAEASVEQLLSMLRGVSVSHESE